MTQPTPSPISTPTISHSSPGADFALTLLGPSAAMAQIWSHVRRLAPYVRTVLLLGKPDCGQEAVARLLLKLSPQSHRMFLQLTAAEAEVRLARSAGLASLPADVFLFLPDADRLSLAAQESLLRLMRLRRSRPFSIVAASAVELSTLVSMNRFLPELADAVGSVRISIPTLRERLEDIPMLINHLLGLHCQNRGCAAPQLAEGFLRAAMQHAWPGNLRELSRALGMLACASRPELQAEDLVSALVPEERQKSAPSPVIARLVSIDTIVNEHICTVLEACRGNKLRAAEILGVSRSTLYRMLDAAAADHGQVLIAAS